jgi:hypothetical protein
MEAATPTSVVLKYYICRRTSANNRSFVLTQASERSSSFLFPVLATTVIDAMKLASIGQ